MSHTHFISVPGCSANVEMQFLALTRDPQAATADARNHNAYKPKSRPVALKTKISQNLSVVLTASCVSSRASITDLQLRN